MSSREPKLASDPESLAVKIDRMNEMFERATQEDRVMITYQPVSWWRQPVTVPAWVYVWLLVTLLVNACDNLIGVFV